MTGAAAPGLPWTWGDLTGTTDHFAGRGPGLRAARGLRVGAPADVVWRWVRQLQVALGHASLATTQIYTEVADEEIAGRASALVSFLLSGLHG